MVDKKAVIHISQNRGIYVHIHDLSNVHAFVCVWTWLWSGLCVYVCGFFRIRADLPDVSILWNCLQLTREHYNLAVSTRPAASFPFLFLFLTIKGCPEFIDIILSNGNSALNEELFPKKVTIVQMPYLPNIGISGAFQYWCYPPTPHCQESLSWLMVPATHTVWPFWLTTGPQSTLVLC